MIVTVITKRVFLHSQFAAMNKTLWSSRYSENEIVYGKQPNQYFKKFIDSHRPGSILLPAEWEGRNAVYAAGKGWKVDAFDFSEEAKQKADGLSAKMGVAINYWLQDMENFRANKKYDAVGLIYIHLPGNNRRAFHREIYNSLLSGGYLVLESFAREQIHLKSGGPKEVSLLYDAPTICGDFPFLHILSCGQREIELNEGEFHKGKAAVLQLTGQKL